MTDALEQAFGLGVGESEPRFATTLERLIHLRTIPSLGQLAARGLTYVATCATERHFAAGDEIYRPDEVVGAVHFLVEGKVRVEQEGLHLLDGTPPFTIGIFPVLSGSQVGQHAVALEPTVTLELQRQHLFEAFEDDFGFVENAIRQLSRQMVNSQRFLESRGLFERSEPVKAPYPHEPLDLVERLALMGDGIYQDMNIEPFIQLVRASEEIRLEPGDVLWEPGEPSTWGVNIAHGVIACHGDDRSFRMGPGSSLGFLECYGLLHRSYRAVAETKVVAMRQPAEVFFDVLEDNFKLAQGFIGILSSLILRFSLQIAQVKADEEEE